MLLFIAISLSVLWVGGCVLGLALGAMLARADGRVPAGSARPRGARIERRSLGAVEHVLPSA